MFDQLTTTVGDDMLVTHFGRMGMALSAMIVVAACGGGDSGADSLGSDTGAVRSASGDVAGSNMPSPAMVTSFLTTVNQAEVEAGKLAQTKGTHAQVKQYGQMLVTEHGRADSMAHSAMGASHGGTAGAAGTTGAADAGGQAVADLKQMHQQAMQALQSQPKGRAWDSTFVATMLTGHQEVLSRLEGMRGTGASASGTAGAAGTTGTPAGTANPGAVGSTGTTQPAGQLNQGDQSQAHLQSSIDMLADHVERAQELQKSLQGGTR